MNYYNEIDPKAAEFIAAAFEAIADTTMQHKMTTL